MTEHDNLSQTLFIFGLIKYVQLTLLHCLIVSEFRRYSPLREVTVCRAALNQQKCVSRFLNNSVDLPIRTMGFVMRLAMFADTFAFLPYII